MENNKKMLTILNNIVFNKLIIRLIRFTLFVSAFYIKSKLFGVSVTLLIVLSIACWSLYDLIGIIRKDILRTT